MTQKERREYLIKYLLSENKEYSGVKIPKDENEQKYLLRSLMNVRMPQEASDEFLRIQDEYLQEVNKSHGITDFSELQPVSGRGSGDFFLWCGDITTLKIGAIVNAANSGMTGCWQPCHICIDNCIHTFAGIQLRQICSQIMEKQGFPEPTGSAKITPAFNLPCDYVLHTVGPIISGPLKKSDCDLLASCYKSCLSLAEKNGVKSIAFCCISTGVFCFPADKAAEIAVAAVEEWKKENGSDMKVVFNVFSKKDENIYRKILFSDRIRL